MSPLSEIVSLPFVANFDNTFAVCCFISARCTTSKLNPVNRRRYRAGWSVEFAKLRINFCAPWSVQMVN